MTVRSKLLALAAAGVLGISAPASAQVEYVRAYRDDLTYVMATESSVQNLTGGFSLYDMDETLESEVYFVYVPADKVWMAVRDVMVADGKKLTNRPDVRGLLNSGQVGAARHQAHLMPGVRKTRTERAADGAGDRQRSLPAHWHAPALDTDAAGTREDRAGGKRQ